MYAHHVIEDLKKHSKHPATDSSVINKIVSGIQEAKHFHFGTVGDLQSILKVSGDQGLFLGELGEYVKLPFQKCWFDFKCESDSEEGKTENPAGLLLEEVMPDILHVQLFLKSRSTDSWLPWACSYYVSVNRRFIDHPEGVLEEIIRLSEVEYPVAQNVTASLGNCFSKNIPKTVDYLEKVIPGMSEFLRYANFFLILLSCQNLGLQANVAPLKVNKKRVKNKKQPLFSFHTLKLKLSATKRKNNDSPSVEGGDNNRIHFCRGHFKTYAPEKPLFGKIVGRYWWGPTVRGDKSKGIVDKNYDFEAG